MLYTDKSEDKTEEQKHSKLGVASFVLSIISIICTFALIIAAITTDVSGGLDENSARFMVIGTLYFLFVGFSIVGIGLGIAGLFAKNMKKVFAILGLVFSTAILVIAIGIMAIGLSAADKYIYY
jgi:hypothetical protein